MESRPSRRAAKKASSSSQISASHFVGYVEDEESVEMIMKKFEALEEYRKELDHHQGAAAAATATPATSTPAEAAAAPVASAAGTAAAGIADDAASAAAPTMSQAQLEELFKRTSNFTVRSAMRPEITIYDDDDDFVDALLNADEGDEEYGDAGRGAGSSRMMGYVDDDFWDDLEEEDRPRKRGRLPGTAAAAGARRRDITREATLNRFRVLQYQLHDRQGNAFTVKRKVRQVDPLVPTYVRVPPEPITRAWAHEILPLSRCQLPSSPPAGSRVFTHNCLKMTDAFVKQLGNRYQAIYLDPPLLRPGQPATPNMITVAELAQLPIPKLITRGMLFIWVDKENIYDVLAVAEQWKFKCVENICWIRMQPNHRIVEETGPLFNKTKLTLLMLRKDGEIELRHQRNPDCVYDFVKPRAPGELTCEKPAFIYEVIETLLPQAIYSKDNAGGDGLLELWARPTKCGRQGWTTVVHA